MATYRWRCVFAFAAAVLCSTFSVEAATIYVAAGGDLQAALNTARPGDTVLLEANAERHLKDAHEMTRLFRRAPEAIDRTLRFLDRCNFSLGELIKTEYPDEKRVGFAAGFACFR